MSDARAAAYTGRILWNAACGFWETPSCDLAKFFETSENNLIAAIQYRDRQSRAGLVRPADALMFREAPEFLGKRKTRTVQPLGISFAGVEYLQLAMLRPWPGLGAVVRAFEEQMAEGPPETEPAIAPLPSPDAGHWLRFSGVAIRDRAEMLNLTDMWRAAGAPANKEPPQWKRLPRTKEFAEFLELTRGLSQGSMFEVRDGRNGYIMAHWHLALAYAKYLSHEFHVACNEIVRNHMEGGNGLRLGAEVLDELAALRTELAALRKQVAIGLEMQTELLQKVTRRRQSGAEIEAMIERAAARAQRSQETLRLYEISTAKQINSALDHAFEHFKPVVGAMVGNAAWGVAEAQAHGTFEQKLAERKAKRAQQAQQRRGLAGKSPPPADDDYGFDFEFDA